MRIQLTCVSAALALAFAAELRAQTSKVIEAQPMEAVVIVTTVDQNARTVTVQGPKGNETVIAIPPEARNLDQVREGTRFKMRFLEETVVSLNAEGSPSSGASVVQIAPRGDVPAGVVARTVSLTAVVEAVDPASRQITVRGPEGKSRTMRVAGDITLDAVKPGDRISLAYTQALATHMTSTPQPVSDPAPAN